MKTRKLWNLGKFFQRHWLLITVHSAHKDTGHWWWESFKKILYSVPYWWWSRYFVPICVGAHWSLNYSCCKETKQPPSLERIHTVIFLFLGIYDMECCFLFCNVQRLCKSITLAFINDRYVWSVNKRNLLRLRGFVIILQISFFLHTTQPRAKATKHFATCQGKTKFSTGQGIAREFWKKCQGIWTFDHCQGNVREFCHNN